MGKIANRQSLAFSERNQLSRAIPTKATRMNANRASQRNERGAHEDQFLCFRGRYERQRTLAIRMTPITLASNSARFRPWIGNEKCARTLFLHKLFEHPQGSRTSQQNSRDVPRLLSSKPKEDKLLREGTNFSAATPSRGRPPSHRVVSGPKKLIFVLFFLAWLKSSKVGVSCQLQEFKGATRLGATRPATLRGKWHSERVSERAFEKPLKISKNLWKPLKASKYLWKPLQPSLSKILSETLSEADFPLRTSQACCP